MLLMRLCFEEKPDDMCCGVPERSLMGEGDCREVLCDEMGKDTSKRFLLSGKCAKKTVPRHVSGDPGKAIRHEPADITQTVILKCLSAR